MTRRAVSLDQGDNLMGEVDPILRRGELVRERNQRRDTAQARESRSNDQAIATHDFSVVSVVAPLESNAAAIGNNECRAVSDA
jgi:hypothetical protein